MKAKAFCKRAGKTVAAFFYRTRFFWKRAFVALLTLFLSAFLIFIVLRLTPGDTVRNYALQLQTQRNISYEEAYSLATRMLNYDPNENVFTGFFKYLGGVFQGNLGQSIYFESLNAWSLIKQRLPWTLFISSFSLLISFLLGTWFGSVMARKRNSILVSAGETTLVVTSAIPDYLIGLLLVMLFSFNLGIFPSSGHYDIQYEIGFNLPFILNVLWHAALPILSFVLSQVGMWALLMRGSAVGVLGEDYIYSARARGLPESLISRKYLKRNALLPLFTSFTGAFASLFGGATLMENVFNYPGIGSELAARISARDWFLVQGILLFTSFMVILVNLITDSVYSLIDPRVRRDS